MAEPTLHLWQVLGTVLGTLAIVALTLWLSKQTLLQARDVWLALRGLTPHLIATVDEPEDPVIAQLAHLSQVSPTIWATSLPAVLRAAADGLDHVLGTVPDPPTD